MKKINLLLIVLVVSILVVSISLVKADCNPNINIVNQDPIPAQPASYVKVIFEVSSLQDCNGFAVKLNPQYPFSLDPGINPIQTLATNPYSPDYKNTWDVPYNIRIADDALQGDYNLKLLYHGGSSTNFDSLSIEKDFNISITDVQTDFATVIQDSSGSQVSIGIVNTGENTANSLIVSIPQQDNFIATGTSSQIVGNLAAGDYTIVSFSITSRNARNFNSTTRQPPRDQTNPQQFNPGQFNASQQNLKIQLDYTDGIGKRRSVVKEIQFNPLSGNLTGSFAGRSRTTSSGISIWWYVLGIVIVVAIVLFFVYKRFHKKRHGKNSEKAPDWVSTDRTHQKK